MSPGVAGVLGMLAAAVVPGAAGRRGVRTSRFGCRSGQFQKIQEKHERTEKGLAQGC